MSKDQRGTLESTLLKLSNMAPDTLRRLSDKELETIINKRLEDL